MINGISVTNVAMIVTAHSAGRNRIRGKIFDSAEPAANKFTAFAVILVKTITSSANTPKPSRLAMVLGSELLGS